MQRTSTPSEQDKGGKEERFGQKGQKRGDGGDNFQTLKMISERNAAGQG